MLAACKLTLIFGFLLLWLQLSATLSRKENSENNGIVMTLHHMRSEEGIVAGKAAGSTQALQLLAKMVQASKDRVSALKRGMPKNMKSKSASGEGSLYAYGNEYYIKLLVGTPPQEVSLVMDTGSHVVWVPCTTRRRQYKCYNGCTKHPTVFLARKSSSAVPVKCADPKCNELCQNGVVCEIKNCSGVCPEYSIRYGTGNTTGSLLSETLTLPLDDGGRREITSFAVGCSVLAFEADGIAGFGRGSGLSMSSQLSPIFGDRFAYCLQSHPLFEGKNKSSRMVIGNKAVPKNIPLNYTPFLKPSTSASNFAYNIYYYLGLTGISIGGKRLKLPSKFLTFDSKGNGGTFIDSGTSFSDFPVEIYSIIVAEFDSQIGYRRSLQVEAQSTFDTCYIVSGVENVKLPEFAFHFKGGSDMVLPSENTYIGPDSHTRCLAMTNSTYSGGPAVTLGNYQQQNFYILYDRKKNRLGFTPKTCETFG